MMSRRYRKSVCKGNFLHKFNTIDQRIDGIVERCERCGTTKFFPNNAPDLYYLQFNIRRVLRANDPLFNREYPQNG